MHVFVGSLQCQSFIMAMFFKVTVWQIVKNKTYHVALYNNQHVSSRLVNEIGLESRLADKQNSPHSESIFFVCFIRTDPAWWKLGRLSSDVTFLKTTYRISQNQVLCHLWRAVIIIRLKNKQFGAAFDHSRIRSLQGHSWKSKTEANTTSSS